MIPRVVKRPSASRDLSQIANRIARDNPRAARRFVKHIEATFVKLAAMPAMAPLWWNDNPRLQDVRIWPVPRYRNYVIIFRPIEGGIRVLPIFHGSHDIEAIFDD